MPLFQVSAKTPLVQDVANTHKVCVGGFATQEHALGTRVVINATIDNLLKGAATQAIQNANLALGLDELTGIY